MTEQVRLDIARRPFVLQGQAFSKKLTIAQDAARTTDLLKNTLMAYVSATKKLVPFTDETATDGSAMPVGIYVGEDIAFADLVAGDVLSANILLGDAIVDEGKLVIENAKTLSTVIAVSTVYLPTVREVLRTFGIQTVSVVDADKFENA